MTMRTITADRRARLQEAWRAELDDAGAARRVGDEAAAWSHLERAHILSQPLAAEHVRTHAAMFAVALRRRDVHELLGQAFRTIVAAPASLAGRYPVGNTGGADVSPFAPMPVPDDLRALLTDTDVDTDIEEAS